MLPNPSSLSLKGSADDQIRYIMSYLTRLVRELNKELINPKESQEDVRTVRDIGFADNRLAITYTDGAVKYITLGE